ncbi:MAG: hypothetical protein ACOZBL_05395 [Patescibacteria group bacterium]
MVAKEQKLLIKGFDFDVKKANQLLFFFKPEVFFPNDSVTISNSINMCIDKIEQFGGSIEGVMLLN